MIAGIFGLFFGWCSFGIPCFIAILLGHAAYASTKSGRTSGHGQTIAGLILGYLMGLPMLAWDITLVYQLTH